MSGSNNNNDEFGDDSLFMDVDVDQLVSQHVAKAAVGSPNKKRAPATNENQPNNNDVDTTKRSKVFHSNDNNNASVLETFHTTLKDFFGYSSFRPGQLEVLEAVAVHKRDAAVFWATGKGKSLCYQIPALAAKGEQMVIVVSPLISLMQDQVDKLNGLQDQGGIIANYLGSGQTDPTVETQALNGQYSLLYVTPEKLVSGNFLERLRFLHVNIKPVALVAVDEAHCVSEWGHDFRVDFRNVGQALRGPDSGVLGQIPILALTATAVPRVQDDLQSLVLRSGTFKAIQSFDRPNLEIGIRRKPSGGVATALRPLLEHLKKPDLRLSQQSTIVYAPTRALVEDIAVFLQKNLEGSSIVVEGYHAGMKPELRHEIHTKFLTGVCQVIVSTVAFGMGIDKPDIRKVIHYGAPKTMEEYYQQIGRAGRDGLPAECQMICSESDFDRYQSDFYLGGLQGNALQATKESMASLRKFALDAESCRRRALLDYFKQPAPYHRCQNCDTCKALQQHGSDTHRDFSKLGARLVLEAVNSTRTQSVTSIVQCLNGKILDDFRYDRGQDKEAVKTRMDELRMQVPKAFRSERYWKSILSLLVNKQLLAESTRVANQGGFTRSYTVFSVTQAGREAFQNQEAPIVLAVPEVVREVEEKEERRRKAVLEKLEANGIKTDRLPAEELEKGDGVVIKAYSTWFSYKERSSSRKEQLETLLSTIENWRSAAAIENRVAPGTILPDHMLAALAYTQATLPRGQVADVKSIGVRGRQLPLLVEALRKWVDQNQPESVSPESHVSDKKMVFDGPIHAREKWKFAIYKPAKKTGLASWERSYQRFNKGESPQAIAMNQEGKRPIQVATVASHILEAVVHGKPVDAARLQPFLPAPTYNEWAKLLEAEVATGMDVTGDPETSGRDNEKFNLTQFLVPIVGDYVANKPFAERSDDEKELMSFWFQRLHYYLALRRVGYEPKFV